MHIVAWHSLTTLTTAFIVMALTAPVHARRIGELAVDSCLTSVDCAMNGECIRHDEQDTQSPGHCRCFQGWAGSRCEELDFLPVVPGSGLRMPNATSTWGGSVVFRDGLYHMFASEMLFQCGLDYWTSNSQVIRAVSKSPHGPYEKVQVILPPFAHEPNAVVAPNGDVVLFVTARSNVRPNDCRTGNSANIPSSSSSAAAAAVVRDEGHGDEPPMDTYMTWAPNPEGPWSEPVMVLNSTVWNSDYWAEVDHVVHCDSNLNSIILDDDSFLGIWRRCETPHLLTIPHTLSASNWRDPSTYRPNIDEPLFVLGGSGAEDPSNIWTTTTHDMGLAYHVLFHDEQSTRCMLGQCSANGRHAFSLDGKSWRYASTDAYNRTVRFGDGTSLRVDTRARPHVLLDPDTNEIIAVTTGIQPNQDSGYVWTVAQGVGTKRATRGKVQSASRP